MACNEKYPRVPDEHFWFSALGLFLGVGLRKNTSGELRTRPRPSRTPFRTLQHRTSAPRVTAQYSSTYSIEPGGQVLGGWPMRLCPEQLRGGVGSGNGGGWWTYRSLVVVVV